MKALTLSRREGEDDMAFQLKLYAAKLAEWPADVVIHVLRAQPGLDRWWPAWHDLEDRLRLYAGRRLRTLAILRGIGNGSLDARKDRVPNA